MSFLPCSASGSAIDWKRFEDQARAQLGKPYKFGAKWPLDNEFPVGPVDCSGFTRWCYYQIGIRLPDGSANQFRTSNPATSSRLGDLGFLKKGEDICHVVILLNDTQVIEARGAPHNSIILSLRVKWEQLQGFTGWRTPTAVKDHGLA